MPHLLSPDCGQLITSHLLTFFLRRTLIFFIRGCLARTIGGNELECARTITDRCHQSGSRMSGRPGTYLLYIHQTSRHEQQVTPCPSGCTMPTATPTASSCLLRPPLPVTSCHSSLPQPPPTPKVDAQKTGRTSAWATGDPSATAYHSCRATLTRAREERKFPDRSVQPRRTSSTVPRRLPIQPMSLPVKLLLCHHHEALPSSETGRVCLAFAFSGTSLGPAACLQVTREGREENLSLCLATSTARIRRQVMCFRPSSADGHAKLTGGSRQHRPFEGGNCSSSANVIYQDWRATPAGTCAWNRVGPGLGFVEATTLPTTYVPLLDPSEIDCLV